MRGRFVAIVGAAAILASAFGLALDGFRAGPFDRPLEPATAQAHVEGTYHTRAATAGPLGVCVQPPCDAGTDIDLVFQGLPPVPYDVRLQGSGGSEPLGTHHPEGGAMAIRWSQPRDHGDKDRLVLAVAGRDVASLPVQGGAEPLYVSTPLVAAWETRPATLRVNEIGGVVISSVASATIHEEPPAGWEFRARLEGRLGSADFGAFEVHRGESRLDGRVERLRLEDHETAVVLVVPVGAAEGDGFPVLQATLWP
jgi:hypothetical protein